MRRRDFVKVVAAAAIAWPLGARAQQAAMPVIGFLRPTRAGDAGHLVAAVRQGLREAGYPSDKVAIEARWADGRQERLPKLAAELVALPVAAIVGSVEAALAAKAATTSFRNRGGSCGSGARDQYQPTGRQHHRRELF